MCFHRYYHQSESKFYVGIHLSRFDNAKPPFWQGKAESFGKRVAKMPGFKNKKACGGSFMRFYSHPSCHPYATLEDLNSLLSPTPVTPPTPAPNSNIPQTPPDTSGMPQTPVVNTPLAPGVDTPHPPNCECTTCLYNLSDTRLIDAMQ
jgi:hypothetical protein